MATFSDTTQTPQPAPARVFIYTLADPETGEIRYVGKALNLKKRLQRHVYAAVAEIDDGHKTRWINSLRAKGLTPIIEALEEIINPTDEQWQEAERYWIESMRCLGFKLTNLVAGGLGCLMPSPETREKLRNNFKGRRHSPETLAKMRQIALDRTPELKAKIKASLKGVKRSPEAVAKFTLIARNRSQETRDKLRQAGLGRKRSVESRAKHSETVKRIGLTEAQLVGLEKGRNLPCGLRQSAAAKMVFTRRNSGAWHSQSTIEKIRAKAIERFAKAT